jgi:hypothetical protein
MEFTLTIYKELLSTLKDRGYSFQTLEKFMTHPLEKVVILRHDVDKLPGNALKMARLEQEIGVVATYYFRAVPESFDEGIMREIAGMGHEIGYHYENLETVGREKIKEICPPQYHHKAELRGRRNTRKDTKKEKLIDLGYEDFCRNLEIFRKSFDIKTICSHGSPLSRYDNRMIWEKYDYRDLGIIAEPYFDVDFGQVFYITDTGRKWNNEGASVRDRVDSGFDIQVKSTEHLIELVSGQKTEDRGRKTGRGGSTGLPDKIMINVHPQRWHDRPLPWVKELVGQNVKNVVKAALIKVRRGRSDER